MSLSKTSLNIFSYRNLSKQLPFSSWWIFRLSEPSLGQNWPFNIQQMPANAFQPPFSVVTIALGTYRLLCFLICTLGYRLRKDWQAQTISWTCKTLGRVLSIFQFFKSPPQLFQPYFKLLLAVVIDTFKCCNKNLSH